MFWKWISPFAWACPLGKALSCKWIQRPYCSLRYFSILVLCIIITFWSTMYLRRPVGNQIKRKMSEARANMKLLPEENYKSLFTYNGIWLAPRNQCTCIKAGHVEVYQMEDYIDKKDIASLTERREKEFEHYWKRYPMMTQDLVIAKPNLPLSYPIQGVEVMPLHTILIPGLRLHGATEETYKVVLQASLGTLNTLADVSQEVVSGRGTKELTISTSDLELLNFILEHVTYTSVAYQLSAVDLLSFKSRRHVARFPVTIRQSSLPKLFDPGADRKISSLVTIATKTFLRYHKLRILIKSIRQFYPDIKIIVADDSEVPEKIDEENVEHYIMPFGKGWFAGRNLAVSQVTTKYYLWIDDDYLFTENTNIEKLVEVLEGTNLDMNQPRRMLSLKVLALLLASLSLVLTEENGLSTNPNSPTTRALQRRYSEAILASDYSRTMDNMLKKNFVEWLLARREKKSENAIDPYKREVEPQMSAASGQGLELASQGGKDFFVWLLNNKRKQSLTSPKESDHSKDGLSLELLEWLMSADLCRPT
ncbi:beta-1,4 N-acetylgalactosaminyltransferase 2 isoform X1 [Carettochelys insculpta]|uniref:beta-1,4 N-acetylgalactosaminyltransferase 2 isoform X1 n=1 Tax=Carettochelys insculpta TaxID=44489 RepID=UPI003EB8D061